MHNLTLSDSVKEKLLKGDYNKSSPLVPTFVRYDSLYVDTSRGEICFLFKKKEVASISFGNIPYGGTAIINNLKGKFPLSITNS